MVRGRARSRWKLGLIALSLSFPMATGSAAIAADSDGDGLSDQIETAGFKTTWTTVIVSGVPILVRGGDLYVTSEVNPDTDGDGLLDGDELLAQTSPLAQDSDLDGLQDGEEVYTHLTNPLIRDSDGDGLLDGDEISRYGLNPTLVDSFITVAADKLMLGDTEFVVVGANHGGYRQPGDYDVDTRDHPDVPGINDYVFFNVIQYFRPGYWDYVQIDQEFKQLRQMLGVNTIRILTPARNNPHLKFHWGSDVWFQPDGAVDPLVAAKLRMLLDLATQNSIKLQIALVWDLHRDRAVECCDSMGNFDWGAGSDQEIFYFTYIDSVVQALGDHPGLLAFEIGNENLGNFEQRDDYVNFLVRLIRKVKDLDSNHLVASGEHAQPIGAEPFGRGTDYEEFMDVYPLLNNGESVTIGSEVDYISPHLYLADKPIDNALYASDVKEEFDNLIMNHQLTNGVTPIILGEFGFNPLCDLRGFTTECCNCALGVKPENLSVCADDDPQNSAYIQGCFQYVDDQGELNINAPFPPTPVDRTRQAERTRQVFEGAEAALYGGQQIEGLISWWPLPFVDADPGEVEVFYSAATHSNPPIGIAVDGTVIETYQAHPFQWFDYDLAPFPEFEAANLYQDFRLFGCPDSDGDMICDECADGIDNDGDGLIDAISANSDPGCKDEYSLKEDPQCNDGIDNDGDGDIDEADSICTGMPWGDDEAPPDFDSDTVPDFEDNCTEEYNPSQADANLDGYGDACDCDFDSSGVCEIYDSFLMNQCIVWELIGHPGLFLCFLAGTDLDISQAIDLDDYEIFAQMFPVYPNWSTNPDQTTVPGPSAFHP